MSVTDILYSINCLPHTQDRHDTDGLPWWNTSFSSTHSKILSKRRIIPYLTEHVLNTSVLTLVKRHMPTIYMKHFLWSVHRPPMTAFSGRNMQKLCSITKNFVTFDEAKSYPRNKPWRPMGLWDVKDPILSRPSAHRWRQCCQPYAPASALLPRNIILCFWYYFF
jgi:hypothetical protein